ncbi:hypothetical protein [Neisseria meningitidis]|nr:hypothetical protein [Neisseria meningitidis]
MEKIHFEWYRGDDELETLVFDSEGEPEPYNIIAPCSHIKKLYF